MNIPVYLFLSHEIRPPPPLLPPRAIPWFPFPEVCGNYPTCGGNRILMLISPMSSPPFSLSHSLSFFYLQHFIYFFIFHLYQSFCIQKVHFSYGLTSLKTFPFSVSRICHFYSRYRFRDICDVSFSFDPLIFSLTFYIFHYYFHLSDVLEVCMHIASYSYGLSLSFSLTFHLSLSLTIHR